MAAALILAFPSGGYFITEWGVASIVLLTLLAVVVLTLDVSFGGPWGLLALGGLAGLGVWQGISSMWALQPSASINAMNQTLLYAAAFALVLVGVRHIGDLNALLWSALAGSGIVTAFALAARLLPDLVSGDDQARLSTPITYWNGLGVIVAFGALLSIGLAAHAGMPNWTRAVAASLTPMFLLALLLTFSRGAAAALILALGLLIALAPGRIETVTVTLLTVGVSIPLLVMANGEEAIAAISGALPPHETEGRRVLLILLATMISSAVVALGAALLLARLTPGRRRVSGLAIAACAVIGISALLVVKMPDAGPIGWTEQQIESFKTFDTTARNDAASVADRLAVAAGSGRWQNWGVAVDQFRESPIVGTGAGDYIFFWEQNRDVDLTVVNAHSLYLEILGETGIVGLLFLLLPAGAIGAAFLARWRRNRESTGTRSVAVALSAAALIGIHSAGDWDWQLPAIVLPATALAAASVKVALLRDAPARCTAFGVRGLVAFGAVLALVLVVGPTISSRSLAEARTLATQGDLAPAVNRSGNAIALAPLDPAPRLLEANLLSDLGRTPQSNAAFAAAVVRSPNDWKAFADWALALRDRGDRNAALVAAEQAVALNPREPRARLLLESLEGTQ